jgi:tRNA threonylcarbamoyladenosine modification (KEOPS) complex  Pcc1 subunit
MAMNEPKVHKSQLLQDREHDSLNTFKAEPNAFVRITIDTKDNKIVLVIYASDDYMEDMISNVRAAILSENLIIQEEQRAVNGRYHIKIK